MISIVTVTYNAESTIEGTLESLLQQTSKNYELVIKDGNSTDETLNIIKKYAEKFINKGINLKVISKKDKSIYDGMNQALEYIECNWTYFLNSGDTFYEKETLEKIEAKLDDSLDIIYGSINNFLNKKNAKIKKPLRIENILKGMIFCHQGVLVKSELIKKEKFNTDFKICADYDFFLKMYLKNKKFQEVDIVVSNYDLNGYSNNNSILTLKETYKIIKNENKMTNKIGLYFNYLIFREKLKNLLRKNMSDKIFIFIRGINLKYFK